MEQQLRMLCVSSKRDTHISREAVVRPPQSVRTTNILERKPAGGFDVPNKVSYYFAEYSFAKSYAYVCTAAQVSCIKGESVADRR